MKVVQIKLYTFKELGTQAKQKALTVFRHTNTDFDWWNDIYEDFITLCATLGVTVDKASIKFKNNFAQGDGTGFSAKVDLAALRNGIASQAWKSYAPLQEFRFPGCNVDRRVLRLVDHGILPDEPQIGARFKAYGIVTDLGIYVVNERKDHDLVFEELDKLDIWFNKVAEELNRFLFESLRKQYEFLTAESTIKESTFFNEHLFTGDGRAAGHLYELSKHHNKTE